MPDAPPVRVFISSTWRDLKRHRRAVHREVAVEMGMQSELFEHPPAAGPWPTVARCQDLASSSDVVVAVLAHRYGWRPEVHQGGNALRHSITELEIRAAERLNRCSGRPIILPFLVDDDERHPKGWKWRGTRDRGPDAAALLRLKDDAHRWGTPCPFRGPADLKDSVRRSLVRWLWKSRGRASPLPAGDVLARWPRDAARGNGPAALLAPSRRAVPFCWALRQREAGLLKALCDSPARLQVAPILGASGIGKTRLLGEWCRKRRSEGHWHAGFLSLRPPRECVDALLRSERPVLAVVDDPMPRDDHVKELLAMLSGRANEIQCKLRVGVVGWDPRGWSCTSDEGNCIVDPIALGELDEGQRRRLFRVAATAITAEAGEGDPPRSTKRCLESGVPARVISAAIARVLLT